jgi:hypothetical protein
MLLSLMRKRRIALIALTAVLATAGVAGMAVLGDRSPLQRTEVDWVTDVADPRGLAGLVENIFFGVVLEQVGTEQLGRLPETQYRVRVTESIKGSLGDQTVVNQFAGRRQDGSMSSIEGDEPLEERREYLFASLTHPNGQWQTVVDVYGTVEVISPAHRDQLARVFRNAAARPLPPDHYWERRP